MVNAEPLIIAMQGHFDRLENSIKCSMAVGTLDILQAGVTSVRSRKWF